MISEIDEALRSLIRSEVIGDVDVVLDAPTKDWAARRNAPTVDVYLYDIREDVRRRERGWIDVRGDDGLVVARRPAPRHFKMSYLVTAWTQRPEDEHRLLSSLLRCFLKYDAIPRHLTVGPLGETGMLVPVTVGLPPPEDRAFADVWSALGGELKPSLDLVVVAPIDLGVEFPAGAPVREGTVVDMSDRHGTGQDVGRQQHSMRRAVVGDVPGTNGGQRPGRDAESPQPGAGVPAARRRRRGTT